MSEIASASDVSTSALHAVPTARRSNAFARRSAGAACAVLALSGLPTGHIAFAQASPNAEAKPDSKAVTTAAAARPSERELLRDFMYYVFIDQRPVALATGTELLGRKLTGAQFVKLVEDSQDEPGRFDKSIARALKAQELEPIAAQMMKLFDTGRLERARNPDEITANIKALTGPIRGKLLARQRLLAAGEYAMPQLLSAVLDKGNLSMQAEAGRLTIDFARQAIMPLCAALPSLSPDQQEQIATILGAIPYKASLPFLSDLAATSKVPSVVAAATRSIDRLGGSRGDTASLYTELAEAYYSEKPEVTSFPGEDHQLLWSFDPRSGLTMTPVRTPVFHEAMAMRLAERSLQIRADDPATVALWVASNFKRELQAPEGYTNPAYTVGEGARREAMYYAVASGSGVNQQVLSRAIDTRNSPLGRKAIAAIEQTAGAANLVAGTSGSGRRPLVEALTYPNRRVQYEAALALATAQPREGFSGAERVVPTLAGAIRDSNTQYAAILAQDVETYQALRKIVEKSGYRVLPQGRSLSDIQGPLAESPALDLIVVHNVAGDRVPASIEEIRANPKVAATPVLVLTGADSTAQLARRYDADVTIAVRPAATGEEGISKSVKGLVDSASGGPITDAEAASYASRSIGALRDLAVSGNLVLNVADASTQLIGALNDAKGDARVRVAEVLSRINQDRAQQALADAALGATAEERTRLLGVTAESAKRFGNQLAPRQVNRVIELTLSKSDSEATAAAALMGALNLPNSDVTKLIVGKK